jgi:hypothetical protein
VKGRLCLELVEQLSETPGVAGVHIMAPDTDAGLADFARKAGRIAQRASPTPGGQGLTEETSGGCLLHPQ